eukprot:354458-Chlamydomonas_euryale.AAC.8
MARWSSYRRTVKLPTVIDSEYEIQIRDLLTRRTATEQARREGPSRIYVPHMCRLQVQEWHLHARFFSISISEKPPDGREKPEISRCAHATRKSGNLCRACIDAATASAAVLLLQQHDAPAAGAPRLVLLPLHQKPRSMQQRIACGRGPARAA